MHISYIYFILTLVFCAGTKSFAKEYKCPATILDSPRVKSVEKNWIVYSLEESKPVAEAMLYLESDASLIPIVHSGTQMTSNYEVLNWTIAPSDLSKIWIGCSYNWTSAILKKKLDPETKRCEVKYKLIRAGKRQNLSSIECF